VLTKDSLEKLLLHLDDDRERAGEKYETLRLGLVRFFEWRGCAFPEDHADESIDRVARKIVEGEEIRNIQSYITAVARFLFMEIVKQRQKQQAALSQLPHEPVRQGPADDDARLECVRRCLQALAVPTKNSVLLERVDLIRCKPVGCSIPCRPSSWCCFPLFEACCAPVLLCKRRIWPCAISFRCCSVPPVAVGFTCGLLTVFSGSGCRACGKAGVPLSRSCNRRPCFSGSGRDSACIGPGRAGHASGDRLNPEKFEISYER
jgi:DNA-directed RNA polymerase specialized sigma24 family protein